VIEISSARERSAGHVIEVVPDHAVRFYESDDSLIDMLDRIVADALHKRHAAIVIATARHVEALNDRLRARGIDVEQALASGQYIVLDAAKTLHRIMIDGWPDNRAFLETVGTVVETAAADFTRVCAFGEMVTLLCLDGKYGAAVHLEVLWNAFAATQPLSLVCAYPASCFGDPVHEERFDAVCTAHTRVGMIGDEDTVDEPGRHRLVGILRRRAMALEREIQERVALERKLALSERELADFLENAADPLHKIDSTGAILWANKAELDLFGYAPDEYIGRHIDEFYVDDGVAREYVRRLVSGEMLRDFPARVKCKNGSVKDVLITSNTFRVDDEFVYARCFTRDVTASGRAERQLREELDVWAALGRAGSALSRELDVDRLAQTITDAAVQLTRAEFGAFFYNVEKADGQTYMLYTLSGSAREAFKEFPMPRVTELFGSTFRGKSIVRSDDILAHPTYGKNAPYHGMPRGHLPVRSYLAVPVISLTGEVHGGLFLGHPEPAMFHHRDELIVSGIAAQAAIAMDNARLFQANARAREELRQLNDLLEERVNERTEAWRRSELQLRRLVTGIADYAIFLLDANGTIVTWNTGAERIKGYSSEEIIGQHYSRFFTEADREAGLPQRALAIAAERGKFETEAWRVRKDGTRFWAGVLLDAIHDDNGNVVGFAKVTRDMTQRRAMEEQLRQSQKIEAIGQLTGGVAHDFNNLLTVIIGNLDIIARQAPEQDTLRRATDQAMRGAQRAAKLTQQLLAFSRRQPLNPRPTDINRLVGGMSDLLQRTLSETIEVETVLPNGLWRAEVDAHQLENALLNLAVNARDAMPDGGKLTIEAANAYVGGAQGKEYEELSPGAYVVICVTDTGIGMEKHVVDRVFEPFFTTKPVGQGTGLGLSQVHGFVKQSGGHIKIHSRPGRGTTVKIYLHRMDGDAIEDPDEGASDAVPGGRETILVVEDDDDVRLHSTESLRELGFTVLEAVDGPSALRVLEMHPEIDLVFTDVGLPGFNGQQLVEQARRLRPDVKVLFTSGYARAAIVHRGRLDEGVEFLAKPFTRAQLASRIRDVLDTSIARSHEGAVALIVEDEPLMRELAAYMLKDIGLEVVETGTIEEALRAVGAHAGFDVALIDVGLGKQNGLDLVAQLRALHARLPIIVASGYDHGSVESVLSPDDRLIAILPKPYDIQNLRRMLEKLGVRARGVRSPSAREP